MNISIPVSDTMELISGTEVSPLLSRGVCKVCYVSDEPNRNGTVITKDVAREMGRKILGSPVVGYFNKEDGDFEGHNRELVIDGSKFEIVDTTKPYGYVPETGRVWFEKFIDEGVEHEYLCCDVYLWTEAYPEAKRVFEQGNNQSMELTNATGTWTNGNNSKPRVFIYNEALIEKLCILGENVEPCFEGAQFKSTFSLENNPEFMEFKKQMFSKIAELEDTLSKGGSQPVFNTYAVEIGGALWNAVYDYLDEKCGAQTYSVEGVYENGEQKFVVVQKTEDASYHQINFSIAEDNYSFEDVTDIEGEFTPSEQFAAADVQAFEASRYEKKKPEDEEPEDKGSDNEGESEGGEEPEEDPKKKKYELDEIPEYVELKSQYEELNSKYEELNGKFEALTAEKAVVDTQVDELNKFKLSVEKQAKQDMIDSFYMLDDEQKKDVVENIDNYSLDDIEAKLSIICVRNKVDFNLDDDNNNNSTPQGLFNLGGAEDMDGAPEWIQAVRETAKKQ